MKSVINNILAESALKVLRPLIRVMLRNGVACGSFEELVRKAYVDEAFAAAKQKNMKTTVSSVSAQTGLSRKEVKRLNEIEDVSSNAVEQKYNRAVRVISGWVNDGRFTDLRGEARVLSVDTGEDSFSDLVKQFSGDITPKAMLDLLLAADCIELVDGRVKLVKQAYVPGKDSEEVIRILGADSNELISTIDHNLTADDEDKRFQRKVSCTALDKNAVDEFKKIANNRSQALLEELDAWLSQHEVEPADDDACYVSLGIYYYEHECSGEII